MMPAVPRRVVFAPALGRRIIGTVFSSVLLCALVGWWIPRVLPVTTGRDERAVLSLLGILVVAAALWGSTLWWNNLRVVVTDEVVEVRRPGRALHSWPRATTRFGLHTTRRYANGLPAGSTRTLIAESVGRRDEVTLVLADRTFAELMTVLDPAAAGVHSDAAPAAGASASASRSDRLTLVLAICAGVALLVGAGCAVLLVSGVLLPDDVTPVASTALVAAAAAGFLGAAALVRRARR